MTIKSLFLKNLSSISFLWIGSLLGAGIALITQIFLAREFSPSDYGVFASGVATISLFASLASFGIKGFWLKIFGLEGWSALRWLNVSFRFLVFSTLMTLTFIAVWADFGPHENSFRWLLFILLPMVLSSVFIELVGGKLQLEERFNALAFWQLAPHLLRFLFILFFIFAASEETTIYAVGVIYALVACVILIAGFFQLKAMKYGRFVLVGHPKSDNYDVTKVIKIKAEPSKLSELLKNTWPFAISSLLYLVYFQSDIILLKYLKGNEAAGIYNIAFVVIASIYLFPNAIYQKFLLPKFHRWAYHDKLRFLAFYQFGNGWMLLLGTLSAAFLTLTMPWIIPLLFGVAYLDAVEIFIILSPCVPIHFLAVSIGAALLTRENIRRKVLYISIAASINVFLNLMLIPVFGIKGAAFSTLFSEFSLLSLYLFAVRKYVFGIHALRGWNLKLKNLIEEGQS